ncbi:ubiquinone biosynthesis protein coq7 [Diplodia corticola]|uniref:5-demethoxyubiquinone hydroxylase, mitochondrial n=1 Tax=Diplodia corticola TaxID=236234 RepID=A0A1J9RJL1_9PEZI|nr:ubiquinone biosynthesis protein coq7 [Diplodia corticola]OJD32755.1 ubiquinone biosynthesis protein coq7 [Diplodia corticola]
MPVSFSPRVTGATRTLRPQFLSASRSVAPAVVRFRRCASSAATAQTPTDNEALLSTSRSTGEPRTALSREQKAYLDSALRVNQAGELAAVLIYLSQTPPITKAHPKLRPLMKHMLEQEEGHFHKFNHLIAKHRIRPTAMYPVWKAAATVLGWGTGVMGREAAMACTEAVETEIGSHYNEQVAKLLEWEKQLSAKGEQLSPDLQVLLQDLRRIRDEELEHLDHAVENDAKEARPYELLTNVIRGGCRAAIWVSERV